MKKIGLIMDTNICLTNPCILGQEDLKVDL